MSIRVLIVDDEQPARERLRQLLQVEPGVEIVGECANGSEAIDVIRRESPDLVFLDIRMPELDGFEILRSLSPTEIPLIVFVTAYDQYALRAFEAGAVAYLLKPFDREQFRRALLRAREDLGRVKENQTIQNICDQLAGLKSTRKSTERLTVKSAGGFLFVKISEIDWIGGADNYAELHVGKAVHLLRRTLASLAHELPPDRFLRISRSFIVNRDRVKELHPGAHGCYLVVLHDGTRLSTSRKYRENQQRLLGKAK